MTDIKPKKTQIKRIVVKIGFWALGRAMQSLSGFDKQMKEEISEWKEGFSISLSILPEIMSLSLIKKNNKIKFIGLKKIEKADLVVEIKNLDTAFRMIIAQWGVHSVYAQHKTAVVGNIVDAMKFIRMIYIVEDILFPPILSKNILKRLRKSSFYKFGQRMHVYFLGLFFGI